MRKLLFGGLALLLLVACQPSTTPKGVAGVVPADNEVSGWTRSGTLDTADTEAELTDLLDAAAQPYIDNKFVSFGRQRFTGTITGGQAVIELRVADMGDTTHAKSLYAALASSGQTPWTGDNPGTEARIKQDSLSCAIDFRDLNFHVWLSIDTGSAPAVEAAKYFALKVAHKADSTQHEPPRPKDVVEIIPVSGEIGDWSRSGNMDIAENQTQLYDLIDGEATIYVDNGFVKCAFQTFSGTVGGNSVSLQVRAFDMGDSSHAQATYAAVATGAEVPWTGDHPGVEARTDESALFDYKVEFWGEKFCIRATIQDKSTAAQDIAKLFANNMWNAIRDTTH